MRSPLSTQTALLERDAPTRLDVGARTLPRLLRGAGADGAPLALDDHIATHGELPLEHKRRRRETSRLIEQLERAGLRGHGGAGFPTARKLRAVAAARGRAIVVVNATEGEPASLKDRTLCQLAPHLMLDGAQLAAQALGADEVLVAVCESASASVETVAAAIDERRRLGGARLRLSTTPPGYVAGQESALVNFLSNGPALPTFTPPRPFEQGVSRRPTLVSNAETYAHIALIARHGSEWFRALGTSSQPGSALVTLSGPVANPAVYEIEHGASLGELIDAAGGPTAGVRAALLGGYAGTWIDGAHLRGVALSDEHLAAHGATLGAGVIALLSDDACPVAETARVARWLANESAGQCGPCINGLDALAATVAEIAAGSAGGDAARRVERLTQLVRRRGACGHPDGVARFVHSALATFEPEFSDHARHGRCEACARPAELPLPAHTHTSARRTAQAVAR
ncbi:MAG TPA: NADH-ubiquinone oxidoreductase-F iron-sulfur binding region domain-containing protein [Solirubrobacteraceae bacterium]|jgi:NADH:ubiquinone oxidoreductase subunit F (NADH-binding)|nr:NADH-ubiquinone oxidoreductase-F iron-sulfur binding region domain-containing protein [Solirubrobacteraceae bacterium]